MAITAFRFGTAFSPLDYAPALWLDDSGSDASVWTDKSGNGRNATQTDPVKRPQIITNALNGRQVRRFNGTTNYFTASVTVNQPLSVFAVFKLASAAQNQLRVIDGAPNRYSINNNAVGSQVTVFAGTALLIGNAGTSPTVVSGVANGANSLGALNGVAIAGNVGTSSLGGTVIIGASSFIEFFHNGDIAEIIIYPTALSGFQRQRVEAYLNQKYAIY